MTNTIRQDTCLDYVQPSTQIVNWPVVENSTLSANQQKNNF